MFFAIRSRGVWRDSKTNPPDRLGSGMKECVDECFPAYLRRFVAHGRIESLRRTCDDKFKSSGIGVSEFSAIAREVIRQIVARHPIFAEVPDTLTPLEEYLVGAVHRFLHHSTGWYLVGQGLQRRLKP
jgi:hypothetical protein